jgi:hypothetical protein
MSEGVYRLLFEYGTQELYIMGNNLSKCNATTFTTTTTTVTSQQTNIELYSKPTMPTNYHNN